MRFAFRCDCTVVKLRTNEERERKTREQRNDKIINDPVGAANHPPPAPKWWHVRLHEARQIHGDKQAEINGSYV